MKVVVWNMQQKVTNWPVLSDWPAFGGADVFLLNEAPPAPAGVVGAIGHGSTVGLEVALGPDRPVKRNWSTAVFSRHASRPIEDARRDRYYRQPLPFGPSRPGSWTAAQVQVGRSKVTAISLYGLLDERSDASVHRSLSELSPIFEHKDYRRLLVLGGDLNILANPRAKDPVRERYLGVLARIKAYGLVDCLDQALLVRQPRRGPLQDCPCGLGKDCRHTWTHRHRGSTVPYQDDYLFASPELARRLTDCVALDFKSGPPSDHAPIIASFAI